MLSSSTSHAIFSHYDLTSAICNKINHSDLVPLMRVSSDFFSHAAPRVWSRLPRVKPLTDLVFSQNPEILRQLDDPNNDIDTGMKILSDLDEVDISRLLLYAPWIKTLSAGTIFEDVSLAEWVLLCFLVKSHPPLLPCLRELTMSGYGYGAHRERIVDICAQGLLYPSLVSLQLFKEFDETAWLTPLVASSILNSIWDRTQNLEVLHILVQGPGSVISSTLLSKVTQLRCLRSLKCSNTMLDSAALCLLGACPRLESLDIYAPPPDDDQSTVGLTSSNGIDLAELVLPTGSFPRLRHLGCRLLPHSVLARLWGFPALAEPLLSIDILFLPEEDGSITGRLVGDICASSPQIQELSLITPNLHEAQILLDFAWRMRPLPLRRLQISGPGMGDISEDEFESVLVEIPGLEMLDIWCLTVNFAHLVLLAKHLPQLRYLNMYVHLMDWPADLDPSFVIPSPSSLLFCGFTDQPNLELAEGYEDTTRDRHIEVLALGIQCFREGPLDDAVLDKDVDLLNVKLQAMHDPADFQVPSFEDWDSIWMYSRVF